MEFSEEERRIILLALAELALSRPGWDQALSKLAERLGGRSQFEKFKIANADRVKAERGPLGA